MPPKSKKKDKEDNEVLTRIAIVSADRCIAEAYWGQYVSTALGYM